MKQRILIIEDDVALSRGIAYALKSDEYDIETASTLKTASILIDAKEYALVILDINLPDGSGLEYLTYLKTRFQMPVILLTANDMETDIVMGLEMGADDYITKPFRLMILRARVNAQLRKNTSVLSTIRIDEFEFAFDAMIFKRQGQEIELSKTEQRLLRLLVQNKGNVLTRATMIDKIWTDGAEYVDENALSVSIKRLRDKLEDHPSKPQYIKTVYGLGYMWAV